MTTKGGMKKSIHHDEIYAQTSFGDLRYTRTMPENVRISTAVDALAHLTESYFSNKADDFSRTYSINGIILLYPELKKLSAKEELNDDDLETIYNASILGGMAINMTGTAFCHTLGYYFTETYHVPHGFACTLFTNDLIDYEYEHHEEYTKKFFNTIHIDKEEFKKTVSSLVPDFHIQMSDEEIEKLLPRYDNNNSVRNTYGTMNVHDIEKVLSAFR